MNATLVVLLTLLVAPDAGLLKKPSTDLETQNLVTVQAGEALCARSGCRTSGGCGQFFYRDDAHKSVGYQRSVCEMYFEADENNARLEAEDREIRAKYGSDGGTP